VWLICRSTLGRGKNKLLVRGIEGSEWVFCPLIKSIKRGKVSIKRCQECKRFIRFEQTKIPQNPPARKTLFFRTTTPKGTSDIKRTLSRSNIIHPRANLSPHVPSLNKERQPLVDVFEEEDHLIILAELPGIDEKDLNIKTDEKTLTISANNHIKNYLKEVRLPTLIKKDTVKSAYRNNILQVRLEKLKAIRHA
jgi:HSP20 family molecular chaperone IbpA